MGGVGRRTYVVKKAGIKNKTDEKKSRKNNIRVTKKTSINASRANFELSLSFFAASILFPSWRRFRQTVATTFHCYVLCVFFFSFVRAHLRLLWFLLSICCLLCIMSNFFPLFPSLFHPAPFSTFFFVRSWARFFFSLYFNVNKFVLCEYYIICQTYSVIQFVHTEFYFVALSSRAVCVCVCVVDAAVASVSFFFFPSRFNEILNFRTNSSGRGTRNWRMLMNKNAWKKESALWHINRHRINIETLMCRWLMTFCFGVFACAHTPRWGYLFISCSS